MQKHDVKIDSAFIPFSVSRNKDSKHPSFNYSVSLWVGGRLILSTDYSMGVGHSPVKVAWTKKRPKGEILAECETGFVAGPYHRKKILPDPVSVLACIAMDSQIIDAGTFAQWCDDRGFDSDSIKDKTIYDSCLQTALQMLRGIGAEKMAELQTALGDY
jgi:hypothetical protein